MYEERDIEYVGKVPGGVEIILIGDYSDFNMGSRPRQTIELDYAAVRKLRQLLAATTAPVIPWKP